MLYSGPFSEIDFWEQGNVTKNYETLTSENVIFPQSSKAINSETAASLK